MELSSPCPLCWVRHQVSPLGLAWGNMGKAKTHHSMTLWSTVADSTNFHVHQRFVSLLQVYDHHQNIMSANVVKKIT